MSYSTGHPVTDLGETTPRKRTPVMVSVTPEEEQHNTAPTEPDPRPTIHLNRPGLWWSPDGTSLRDLTTDTLNDVHPIELAALVARLHATAEYLTALRTGLPTEDTHT